MTVKGRRCMRNVKNFMKNTATSKKEYADLDKASQTIDDYLVSLRDEPEQKRKKGELE